MGIARRAGTGAVLFVVFAARTAVGEGVGPPPPPLPCTTDLDCPGCERCENGACPGVGWSGVVCFCDDECARSGAGSCDLSDLKPLCGGHCVPDAPARPLACGGGIDTVTVEPFVVVVRASTGGASIATGRTITFDPVTP